MRPTLRSWQELLELLNEERHRILAQPYTAAASRRLEAVDDIEASVWDELEGKR